MCLVGAAKLLSYKGLLSTGMILAVMFKEDAYRIAFDREELGVRTIPADDVAVSPRCE